MITSKPMDKVYEPRFDITTILGKFGSTSIYYGIEIEVEFCSDNDRIVFIRDFYTKFNKWILKREPSILCGIEIVSAPMSIDILENEIKGIVIFCKEYHGVTNERTGIHIHATKTSNQLKIFQFVNNPKHREEFISFCGRLSEYARYTTRTSPINRGRGYCINIYPKYTTEFRMFLSKIDYEWIIGCLYLCDVIVKNIDKLREFTDILEISKVEYPQFFIDRLSLVKKTPIGYKYPLIQPISTNIQYW